MTPPLPINPIQLITNAASGGTWASGSGQIDDAGSAEILQYAEYRQWLTIDYTRNPQYANRNGHPENPSRNLTQLSAVDVLDIHGTQLHCKITAHSSCTITSATYGTSSFYQAQKFGVQPSKYDKIDSSIDYGDVSGNGLVFGAQGRIVTTQPYIRRTLKVYSDSPYNITHIGSNFAYQLSSAPTVKWGPCFDIYQEYEKYLYANYDIHTGYNYPFARREVWGSDSYQLYGAYAVSGEDGYLNHAAGIARLEQFIEAACTTLINTNYRYRLVNEIPTDSDGSTTIVEADRMPIHTHYNSARHDYT